MNHSTNIVQSVKMLCNTTIRKYTHFIQYNYGLVAILNRTNSLFQRNKCLTKEGGLAICIHCREEFCIFSSKSLSNIPSVTTMYLINVDQKLEVILDHSFLHNSQLLSSASLFFFKKNKFNNSQSLFALLLNKAPISLTWITA